MRAPAQPQEWVKSIQASTSKLFSSTCSPETQLAAWLYLNFMRIIKGNTKLVWGFFFGIQLLLNCVLRNILSCCL